ncbi:MAG: shikimate dehydrogenase [Hyphomicrobiaceae bacterium]
MSDTSSRAACVIGWPIKHSRSPMIHGYWLAKYGIDGSYDKRAVHPDDLEHFLNNLSDHGYVGCSVTVPHKERAFALAVEKDASAVAVSAANTLWLDDGRLCAKNTDTEGFMAHLSASVPNWQKRDAPVTILGAGGAARAIVYGFLNAGVGEIRVVNRTKAKTEKLVKDFDRLNLPTRIVVGDWQQRQNLSLDAGVIVNTTTIGMNGEGDLGLSPQAFKDQTVVADIVYVPLETNLLRDAKASGHQTVDGLGMLLHQGVPGFEKWFGVRPTVSQDLHDLVVADLEQG